MYFNVENWTFYQLLYTFKHEIVELTLQKDERRELNSMPMGTR